MLGFGYMFIFNEKCWCLMESVGLIEGVIKENVGVGVTCWSFLKILGFDENVEV